MYIDDVHRHGHCFKGAGMGGSDICIACQEGMITRLTSTTSHGKGMHAQASYLPLLVNDMRDQSSRHTCISQDADVYDDQDVGFKVLADWCASNCVTRKCTMKQMYVHR